MKVLIADDELVIRKGLKNVIDWNRYGFTICGEAANGREALEKAFSLQPDLIIADIKMPGMDGLEMLEEVKLRQPRCRFIILTGYSEFEYARTAIDLGVDGYLLKPVEESELIEKLDMLRTKIMNDRKADIVREAADLAADRAIQSLIFDAAGVRQLEDYNELYSLDLPWSSYQIILVSFNGSPEEKNRQAVEMTLRKFASGKRHCSVFMIKDFIGMLLGDTSYSGGSILPLRALQREIHEIHGEEVFISIGKPVEAIEHLSQAYGSALQLLGKKFTCSSDKIIAFDLQPLYAYGTETDAVPNLPEAVEKLFTAVDMGNEQYVNDLLEDFKERMVHSGLPEKEIKTGYVNLYTGLINLLVKNNKDIVDSVMQNRNIPGEILDKHDLQRLHGFFKYLVCSLCGGIRAGRPDSMMKTVLNYINNNYTRKITLASISETFSYNSTYFGRLFRRNTGLSFNEYIDKVRIENAKRLLVEGRKVNDIAREVGYSSHDYFYSKFKKLVGIAPTDYRKSV